MAKTRMRSLQYWYPRNLRSAGKTGGKPKLLGMHAKLLQSCPTLCYPPGSQAPLFMGFSTQEYWSGLPCPPPGDLPDPGTEPVSLLSPALAGGFFTTSTTWEAHNILSFHPKSHFCVYFIMYKLLV